jgi:hypothetical protein
VTFILKLNIGMAKSLFMNECKHVVTVIHDILSKDAEIDAIVPEGKL